MRQINAGTDKEADGQSAQLIQVTGRLLTGYQGKGKDASKNSEGGCLHLLPGLEERG